MEFSQTRLGGGLPGRAARLWRTAAIAAASLFTAAATPALANIEWTGGSSSAVKYWDDAANWSGTDEPHRFHVSTVNGAAATVVFTNAQELSSALWVENNLSGVVTFSAESDEFGLSQPEGAGNVNIGTGTQGALKINGGTYHFANDIIAGNGTWSENARGDFTLSSGRVETHYWLVLGIGEKSGAQGNVTVEGGELVVGFRDGAAGGNALIEMGRAANSTNTFAQTGGVVSSESNGGSGQPALIIANGENSTATYTISGGSYTARAGNVLMANSSGTTATLNLNGGTFATESIVKGSGTATVNLNGGTLAATADGALIGSGVTLNVGENGGFIDTYGYNVTIAGTVKGSGDITIKGGGSVSFTGDTSAWTGTAANFIVGAESTTVWLGDERISGSVHVAGTLKFGTPADVPGCDLDYDFGTGDFDANFTNLGGELTDGAINGRAAKYSDTFKVQLLADKGCLSTFAVLRSDSTPNYGNLFMSTDTGGRNPTCRWFIGRHNNTAYWERYSYNGWAGTGGIYQNGVAGCPITNNPFVFSCVGLWTRNVNADKVIFGNSYPMTWGEVALYNREVTEAERVGIEDYLMWKWNFKNTYAPLTSANAVTMADGATLDLGGLDVTAASFAGAGTVQNGTLTTADGVFTQSGGTLTIPAVDRATYVASSSLEALVITGGEGKSVTVRIPSDWFDEASVTQGHAIFCEGNVTFVYDGWQPDEAAYRLDSGWWHLYDTEEDADAEMNAELARQDALLDAEKDTSGNPIAFPGARGFGRFAKGARASSSPKVLHVTNLNDTGTGSLRWAVTQSNAIVVFDVSGVINIESAIVFGNNLYIAGQTAPGEGITVYGNRCSFSGSSNIICRYLRWRMGNIGPKDKDCAGIANGTNMIFDHCSFSWGRDETFSINPDNKGDLGNITLQNCIFGQGLLPHSAGGLMQANGISLYRNLYIDNKTRNNKIKGINQYVNNIVYNWGSGTCYDMGGDSEGVSHAQVESCLFINGPSSGSAWAFSGGNAKFHFYGNDNWQDRNRDGVLEPSSIDSLTGGGDKKATLAEVAALAKVDFPSFAMYPGDRLADKNLPMVGASLPYRDQADCYMVDEVMSFGKEGTIIAYESSLPIGDPTKWEWWAGETRTDADGDGMPDDWEAANGTNPNSDDATAKAANGYLNIENYINSITADDRQFFLRKPMTPKSVAKTTTSITVGWRDYTYGEDGFEVEVAPYGTSDWTVGAAAPANATSCEVENLQGGTYYNVRVRAFADVDGSRRYSGYSATAKLYTSVGDLPPEVDIDNYEPNDVLAADQSLWDNGHSYWTPKHKSQDGDKVLLNTDTVQTLNIQAAVAPESIVVNGTGTLTLKKLYNLTGSVSINKGNAGTLILDGNGPFTGPIVNHGGVIEFSSIADGGVNSNLGASLAFPDFWVFDGGTYRYTGADATSDRNAFVRKDSALQITSATLKLTGEFEGEGGLSIEGAGDTGGTLSIADASFFSYSGATAIRSGATLYLSTESAMRAFAPSQLVMGGGAIKFSYKGDDDQTMALPMELEEGTTSSIWLPEHGTLTGRITGTGALQFYVPYIREYVNFNLSEFEGTIIAAKTGSQNSVFMPKSSWNAPRARFNLKSKASMAAWETNGKNFIGGLSGSGGTQLVGSSKATENFKCSWTVGGANTDETFAGVICNKDASLNDRTSKGGQTSITKVGTGYWRLTGANTHSGATTVNEGALIINGTHPSSSAITVNNGGTLRGCGTIASTITVNSGGTLFPGDPDISVATNLFYSGAVTMNSGSKLKIAVALDGSGKHYSVARLRPTDSSSATLTVNSGVTLEFDLADGVTFKDSDTVSIASLVPYMSGNFDTILPATPGKGLKWDASSLASTKTVKVVVDPDYVPVPEMVEAGGAVSGLTSDEADEMLNSSSVAGPSNASSLDAADIEAYKRLFSLVKTPDGNGTYSVSAQINAAGTNTVVEAVEAEVETVVGPRLSEIAAATGDTTIGIQGIPGLFYSVESGSDLKRRSEGDRAQAGRGGAVNLTFPRCPGMGFYRILVNVLDM